MGVLGSGEKPGPTRAAGASRGCPATKALKSKHGARQQSGTAACVRAPHCVAQRAARANHAHAPLCRAPRRRPLCAWMGAQSAGRRSRRCTSAASVTMRLSEPHLPHPPNPPYPTRSVAHPCLTAGPAGAGRLAGRPRGDGSTHSSASFSAGSSGGCSRGPAGGAAKPFRRRGWHICTSGDDKPASGGLHCRGGLGRSAGRRRPACCAAWRAGGACPHPACCSRPAGRGTPDWQPAGVLCRALLAWPAVCGRPAAAATAAAGSRCSACRRGGAH